MGVLLWIVIGLVAGALGEGILPPDEEHQRRDLELLTTLFIGIGGALAGGLLAAALGLGSVGFEPGSIIVALVGAMVALLIWKAIHNQSARYA